MAEIKRVVLGAKCVLYVNGQLLGRATDFSWRSNTPRKEIRGIDVAQPLELAPTTTSITGSISLLRTTGDSGSQGAGLVMDQSNVTREKYITILLLDRSTDITIFKTDYASTTGESWGVSAKGIIRGSLEFDALIWGNEFLVR